MNNRTIRVHKKFESNREKAWHNVMLHAINEGLTSGRFSLASAAPLDTFCEYRFTLTTPQGQFPVLVATREITYDELSVTAAVCLTDMPVGTHPVSVSIKEGIANANGWLERKTGKYLQSLGGFSCRRDYLHTLAELKVEPLGYKNYGPFQK